MAFPRNMTTSKFAWVQKSMSQIDRRKSHHCS